jgi:ribosomal protein S18 acetylase RimI-like enzyme
MADAIARARRRGAATLWLGVWERNARGIRFYQREGFTHVGAHPFILGRDVQTDWIMVRSLDR